MRLLSFSVLDKAVGAFLPPFFARSRAEALRSFITACGDDKTPFASNPEDFILYELSWFDDATGLFEHVEPVRVMGAYEILAASKADAGQPVSSVLDRS